MGSDLDEFYFSSLFNHYKQKWGEDGRMCSWEAGPIGDLPQSFKVIEFAPSKLRKMWTYATCGMSIHSSSNYVELHIFSSKQDRTIVELLTMVAYYHHNTATVGLNHTVNFGRPWQKLSKCSYGLISLPYLDGPDLENLSLKNLGTVKCYWLVPVTYEEVQYKKKFGIEALEENFEEHNLDYIDTNRNSTV